MLFQLYFKLWIQHREPHFLNTPCYIFIVICAVLYTSTSRIWLFYRSLWSFVCWVMHNTEAAACLLCYCYMYCEENVTVRSPCDIILVEHWNSSYVVLTVKCLFILIMVRFLSLCETKSEKKKKKFMQLVKKYVMLNTVCKTHIALLEFSFPNVAFPSTLQLFLIFFGIHSMPKK